MNIRSFVFGLGFVVGTVAVGCAAEEDTDATSAESDLSVAGGTACIFGRGIVRGEIERKYLSVGGCTSFLGPPVHGQLRTPDARGEYAAFYNGSIYYRPDLGPHVVRGEIRELWKAMGWEAGPMGYPIVDETVLPDGGRYSVFEGGSIYWSRRTGAHEVRGAIRDTWAELGWEAGGLGYPTTGEQVDAEGNVTSFFERGSVTWTRASGEVNVKWR